MLVDRQRQRRNFGPYINRYQGYGFLSGFSINCHTTLRSRLDFQLAVSTYYATRCAVSNYRYVRDDWPRASSETGAAHLHDRQLSAKCTNDHPAFRPCRNRFGARLTVFRNPILGGLGIDCVADWPISGEYQRSS